ITDGNGCTSTSSVSITQPNTLTASAFVTAYVSCNGNSNGSATSLVTGGTATYKFSWSNGATTSSISNLIAGGYTLTITDANGCTSGSSVSITQPNTLTVSASVTAYISCNGNSNGSATSLVTGGTATYKY